MGMLLNVRLRLRRNVRMKHLDTQPTPSAPSGPRKFAVCPRSPSRSTPPLQGVPRNLWNFALLQDVDSKRERKNAMRNNKQSFKMLPRKTVTSSPRELVTM